MDCSTTPTTSISPSEDPLLFTPIQQEDDERRLLIKTLERATNQIETLQERIEMLQTSLFALFGRNADLEKENRKLEKTVINLTEETAAYKEKITALVDELDALLKMPKKSQ